MTTTFNFKAKKDGQPLYKQLARYFRDEIQEDHLQGGDMLPFHPQTHKRPQSEPHNRGSSL